MDGWVERYMFVAADVVQVEGHGVRSVGPNLWAENKPKTDTRLRKETGHELQERQAKWKKVEKGDKTGGRER